MDEYWNKRFVNEKLIWGLNPSLVAVESEKIFKMNNIENILILGIGYGRNGKYYIKKGYNVDGIEISIEAINIGKEFCPEINFIYGSVLSMDLKKEYDAVICYSIIHLFQRQDREIIIENCINHCCKNGLIVISCFSIKDKTFGIGKEIEVNTFETKPDKIVHFYDRNEMENISNKLELVKLDYSSERIETEKRIDNYEMIYGLYRKK